MADDLVREDAPCHHLGPVPVVFHLELPRLRAHRVLRRHDLDRTPRQRHVHGVQGLRRHLPWIEPTAVVETEDFRLVERLEVRGIETALAICLPCRP